MRSRLAVLLTGLALLVAALAPVDLARADDATPSPSPSATPSPEDTTTPTPVDSPSPTPTTGTTADPTQSPSPTLSPTQSPSPTLSPGPSPTPSLTPNPTPSPTPPPVPTTVTLRVTAANSPGGRFYEDLGSYAFSGRVTGATQIVAIYWSHAGTNRWTLHATARPDASGAFAASRPVGGAGRITFRATVGSVRSADTTVTVSEATVAFATTPASIDALTGPALRGQVSPARAGVPVLLQVVRSGRASTVGTAASAADGSVAIPFRYGVGSLASYQLRLAYRAANRARWETSPLRKITRIKVLAPVVTPTTSADVAKTYRAGCPVGPSKLRTIRMNFYGYDRRMHRGVIIVRSTLVERTIDSFANTLRAGFPLAKMNNPNVYGGNDPKQMADNNTSGFNCRKVVGNPYRMSPHSYGTALDVNTVQNPYRDRNGKWWPSAGKKYIDRTPLTKGMLGKKSTLTRSLAQRGYFWGGRWNPGRDYQHFEHR